MTMEHLKLGASLYVPATRTDLHAIVRGEKLGHVRSVIFCTEDSVHEADLPLALNNLEQLAGTSKAFHPRLHFVRARNPQVLAALLKIPGIERMDGFVLPKVTVANLPRYLECFAAANRDLAQFRLMPTLETEETFCVDEMYRLCDALSAPDVKPSVLSLRIGGNDLLNLLGIRRSRYRTIYESPLGATIASLVTIFKPCGFNLTSPVCEFLYDHAVLEKEVAKDAEYGLFGKTAIHPDQVPIIEQSYMPSEQEVTMALAILKEDAPAVFNMHGTMCEVATHSVWARDVIERSRIYGTYGMQLALAPRERAA
jgi:citrate lyase beta subunit